MNDIEEIKKIIDRHLGKATDVELENEDGTTDIFKMNPLPIERVPELYDTVVIMKDVSKENPSAVFKNITPVIANKIVDLAVECLKPNYPEELLPQLKEIVMRNILVFVNAMWSYNIGIGTKESPKQIILDDIKEKQRKK